MPARLISILGPPAVGKTTFAAALAAELPAGLIREDFAGNPFLAESFTGRADLLLPSQLYFLFSRVRQLFGRSWPESGRFVSDYGFCQDRIFAEAKLSPADLRRYEDIAELVEGLVHPPDVIIHLDADVDELRRRIAARGRDFERAMDEGFLARMRAAYDRVEVPEGCRRVRVDCRRRDLRDPAERQHLVERIRRLLPEDEQAEAERRTPCR